MVATDAEYLRVLCRYFEEEIEGEAYFRALAENAGPADAREKLLMLARVERCAAEAVRPLLDKYGLKPQPDAVLHPRGEGAARKRAEIDWNVFIDDMATRFPAYLVDFKALEDMAPTEDLPALRFLTRHEIDTIAFAEREREGAPDSAAPLRRYIQDAGG